MTIITQGKTAQIQLISRSVLLLLFLSLGVLKSVSEWPKTSVNPGQTVKSQIRLKDTNQTPKEVKTVCSDTILAIMYISCTVCILTKYFLIISFYRKTPIKNPANQ